MRLTVTALKNALKEERRVLAAISPEKENPVVAVMVHKCEGRIEVLEDCLMWMRGDGIPGVGVFKMEKPDANR